MRVSTITAVLDGIDTIEDCIKSVVNQTYPNTEHIIIDGGSTDGTVDKIRKYDEHVACWTSEPDNGIYDAFNKGIEAATGEVVGVLGADDLYADEHVIEAVAEAFTRTGADSCYGDLLYVACRNTDRIVRSWVSSPYVAGLFRRGWMPPHPTFFVKRELLEKYGRYRTNLRNAADYELMLRLLEKHRISTCHIPKVLVRMRLGGATNRGLRSLVKNFVEDLEAWRVNGLGPSLMTIAMKKLRKLPQFWKRPRA